MFCLPRQRPSPSAMPRADSLDKKALGAAEPTLLLRAFAPLREPFLF
jgi:hypothetical protein